nr:S9 family peptidase [uncultured Actinoplanes sp.]
MGGDVTVLPLGWTSLTLASEASGSWSPTLSPDGMHAAYVSDRSGRPQVWVQPVGSSLAFLVDTGPAPVSAVQWSTGGGWLACQLAPGGAPRHEVWLVRPDGSGLHQVAGFGSDTADTMRWLPGRSLLAVTENLTTALLIDPVASSRTIITTGELISLLDVNADGDRALLRVGPRGDRTIVLRALPDGPDEPVAVGEQAVFGPDGRTVYARSEDGEFPVLVRDGVRLTPVVDSEVEAFALTADGRRVAVLWNVRGGQSEVSLLAERSLPLPGPVVSGLTWSFDGSALAFTAEGPGQPHGVWVYTDAGGLVAVSADPAAADAVRPSLEAFAAHDGLTLTGWLFRPRTPGPHPAVVWLHGGPEAQERPGHGPLFQSLVARGIAVFAPNVRGSSGFGRTFVNADNLGLRYGAVEDVRSSVRYLVNGGIADTSRVGCMGRSYGGYLTLAALTSFPDLFAVGIDVCGMSNFFTFYEHTEPWIAAAAVSKYGDPIADRDLLADLSPINRIDRLKAPLLIVHGENDSNVPVIEAEQVARALAARGVEHRYLLFPDEGHELLHRSSRADYLRETVDWLTTHLLPPPHRP